MSSFKKFLHVQRLDSPDVEGLLDGPVWLSYKLDGTNSSIWFDEVVRAGSRNRELSAEKDNAGFYNWVMSNDREATFLRQYVQDYPQYIIYGEFLGTNKFVGHIKGYDNEALNKLWVFAIYDRDAERYLPSEQWREFLNEAWEDTDEFPWSIPAVYMENPTIKKIAEFAETNTFLLTGLIGEGIVVVRDDYLNKYGHFEIGKYVREEFKQDKTKKRNVIPAGETEKEIVEYLVTKEELAKAKAKLELELGEFTRDNGKFIGMFMNMVFNDTIIDEMPLIIKKWKMPVIDFKAVKRLSDTKCRDYLDL